MNLPTAGQLSAAGRHVVTFAAGGITAAAALHVVSSGDAATLTNSLNEISSGVAQIAAGLAPLIGLLSAAYAAWTASPTSQIAAVNNADNGLKVVKEDVPAPQVNKPLK